MAADITLPAAFLAGLISFVSPCVLPLVPPYLCFLAGTTFDQLSAGGEDRKLQRKVFLSSLAFVLGFATVFVLLGATASAIGQVLRQHLTLLGTIAGVAIIIMGLHFLGVFRIGLLYRAARFQTSNRPVGMLGAYGMGLAFAFGWTPCIGPVLAAILSVAAARDSVGQGMVMLAVYSAGLGIPFLLAAFAVKPFLGFMRRFRGHYQTVERVMGGLLVITGILFLTGSINTLSFWLLETFPGLAKFG